MMRRKWKFRTSAIFVALTGSILFFGITASAGVLHGAGGLTILNPCTNEQITTGPRTFAFNVVYNETPNTNGSLYHVRVNSHGTLIGDDGGVYQFSMQGSDTFTSTVDFLGFDVFFMPLEARLISRGPGQNWHVVFNSILGFFDADNDGNLVFPDEWAGASLVSVGDSECR